MYTAKIFDKSFIAGVLRVQVEFTNGVESLFESCVPQDEQGLKHWIKSRLAQLNFASDINSKLPNGTDIDVTDSVVAKVAQTPEELAQIKWVVQYLKWIKIKTTLIDTGILTGDEPKIVALKTKVQEGFVPSYLDLI